jgi:hypothetical protein
MVKYQYENKFNNLFNNPMKLIIYFYLFDKSRFLILLLISLIDI